MGFVATCKVTVILPLEEASIARDLIMGIMNPKLQEDESTD